MADGNVKQLYTAEASKALHVELDELALTGLSKMPVDVFDNVYLDEVKPDALVLCVDIRNFSSFLCSYGEDEVFPLIKSFTSNLLSCVNQFGFGCSYYKLMGDGAIVIWDACSAESIAEALAIFNTYTEFVDDELFQAFPDLGLGGALVVDKVYKYEISAEASQLKYRDYVGYGINLACRLQTLACKDELILNENLAAKNILPQRSNTSAELIQELKVLKGLKEEDRQRVIFYTRAD